MKHIVVGGIVPRTKKNTEKYNKELNSICRQENIDFVNHSENFLLKNGKIVNGLLYSDGVHLTKDGTSLLINNISDKVGILKHKNDQNETLPNGAPKGNKNVHALTVERAIIHKINVDLMLDLNVINATVLVTKLNFVG